MTSDSRWSGQMVQTTSTSAPTIIIGRPAITSTPRLGPAPYSVGTVPAVLGRSTQRLTALSTLADGWDSYGGKAPSERALQATRSLLSTLEAKYGVGFGTELNPVHIAPLPIGGVQLEWAGGSQDIEVEISPSGDFAYLLIDRTGEQRSFAEEDTVPAATIVGLVAQVLIS